MVRYQNQSVLWICFINRVMRSGTCVSKVQLCDSVLVQIFFCFVFLLHSDGWLTISTTFVEELLKISNIGFLNPKRTFSEVCVERCLDTFRMEKEHQGHICKIGRPFPGGCEFSLRGDFYYFMFCQLRRASGFQIETI